MIFALLEEKGYPNSVILRIDEGESRLIWVVVQFETVPLP